MRCDVNNCTSEDARFSYTWAWGQEGHCCDAHKSFLEDQSRHVGREVQIIEQVKAYSSPKMTALPPDVGMLLARVESAEQIAAKLQEENGALEVRVFELEAALDDARAELARQGQPPAVIEGEPATKP